MHKTNPLISLRYRKRDEDAFTLIELMVVVLIIGILAAIAIPIFLGQQEAANRATVRSDVRNTVSNVGTALVTDPSAPSVTNAWLASKNMRVVQTDNGNLMTVSGSYEHWQVRGENEARNFCYMFDSSTGRYTLCDGTPDGGDNTGGGGEENPGGGETDPGEEIPGGGETDPGTETGETAEQAAQRISIELGACYAGAEQRSDYETNWFDGATRQGAEDCYTSIFGSALETSLYGFANNSHVQHYTSNAGSGTRELFNSNGYTEPGYSSCIAPWENGFNVTEGFGFWQRYVLFCDGERVTVGSYSGSNSIWFYGENGTNNVTPDDGSGGGEENPGDGDGGENPGSGEVEIGGGPVGGPSGESGRDAAQRLSAEISACLVHVTDQLGYGTPVTNEQANACLERSGSFDSGNGTIDGYTGYAGSVRIEVVNATTDNFAYIGNETVWPTQACVSYGSKSIWAGMNYQLNYGVDGGAATHELFCGGESLSPAGWSGGQGNGWSPSNVIFPGGTLG